MIQHIDSINERAKVGTKYIVPNLFGYYKRHYIEVPIISIIDSDDFGSHKKHYHVDIRFLKPSKIPGKYGSEIASILCDNKLIHKYGNFITFNCDDIKNSIIEDIEMICLRDYGSLYQPLDGDYFIELQHLWDKKMVCMKCPHRGYNLNQAITTRGGSIVVCPMHGLRWNKETGKRVPVNE